MKNNSSTILINTIWTKYLHLLDIFCVFWFRFWWGHILILTTLWVLHFICLLKPSKASHCSRIKMKHVHHIWHYVISAYLLSDHILYNGLSYSFYSFKIFLFLQTCQTLFCHRSFKEKCYIILSFMLSHLFCYF